MASSPGASETPAFRYSSRYSSLVITLLRTRLAAWGFSIFLLNENPFFPYRARKWTACVFNDAAVRDNRRFPRLQSRGNAPPRPYSVNVGPP